MTAARNRCPNCGSPTTPNGHHVPTLAAFPLDAEQLVRLASFALNLWHVRTQLPGETIPSAEQLTLDLAAAVGVSLPTRQDRVAILANGTKVQTTLLPYGSKSIPARLDPETA